MATSVYSYIIIHHFQMLNFKGYEIWFHAYVLSPLVPQVTNRPIYCTNGTTWTPVTPRLGSDFIWGFPLDIATS